MSVWFTVPGVSLGEAASLRKSLNPSTSSAGASPARTSATPARASGSGESAAACGLSICESFAIFDPDGWSSRTLLLFGAGASEPFSGDWPASGTMLSGRCYRRPKWAPRTFGSGYSSSRNYPTPKAADARSPGPSNTTQGGPSLTVAICYPTPSATNYGSNQAGSVARPRPGEGVRLGLETMARRNMWPTAIAGDGAHAAATEWGQLGEQIPGSLNPAWVELLMGFPPGYTEAPIPKSGNEE